MPPRKSNSTKYDANILVSAFCMDKAKQIMVQRPYGDLKLSQKDITDMRRKLTSEISKTIAGEKKTKKSSTKSTTKKSTRKTTKKTTEKKPRGRKARPNRVAKLVMPKPVEEPIPEPASEPISQPVVDIP